MREIPTPDLYTDFWYGFLNHTLSYSDLCNESKKLVSEKEFKEILFHAYEGSTYKN